MIKSELEQDINTALKILYLEPLTDEEQQLYNKLYPWSNEGISNYYKYYDLTNKKALCITGSGDHLLYAAAAGATEIDSFDKNRLCKYYTALKVALILSYNEINFFKHFVYKQKCILSNNINLNHLKTYLSDDYFIFWEQIINTKAFKTNKYLFRFDGFPSKFNLDYKQLQKALSKTKINYYDMNAQEFLDYTENTYDAIFLSNILEWMSPTNRTILSQFYHLLNDNGVLYDYHLKRTNSSSCSSSSPIIKPETQIITSPGIPGIEELSNQKVLVYRKTKI